MKLGWLPHSARTKRREQRFSVERKASQHGVTLIELMVGITIGLVTIAVAIGSLGISRGISGSVSEASQMQQQAAYLFRVIGQQARQAGSIRLNLAFGQDAPTTIDAADLVAFETTFDRVNTTVGGTDSPGTNEYQLSLGYQNYTESTFAGSTAASFFRDCLGQQPSATIVESGFRFVRPTGATSGELSCAGANNVTQPMLNNVADFQVRYLVQVGAAAGNPTIQYRTAAQIGTNWNTVFGTEVCLELVGTEVIETAGATYRDCNWTVGTAEKSRGNRLRMVFRNTFQIRSQGGV
jgi:type IV pilus assembly protein PilW